jgi:hypothetical protein
MYVAADGSLLPVGDRVQTTSYLSLFITIDPPLRVVFYGSFGGMPLRVLMCLSQNPQSDISTDSAEDPALLAYARHWVEAQEFKFPSRSFRCVAQDINGMEVLITRYVAPQTPPRQIVDVEDIQANLSSCVNFIYLKHVPNFLNFFWQVQPEPSPGAAA